MLITLIRSSSLDEVGVYQLHQLLQQNLQHTCVLHYTPLPNPRVRTHAVLNSRLFSGKMCRMGAVHSWIKKNSTPYKDALHNVQSCCSKLEVPYGLVLMTLLQYTELKLQCVDLAHHIHILLDFHTAQYIFHKLLKKKAALSAKYGVKLVKMSIIFTTKQQWQFIFIYNGNLSLMSCWKYNQLFIIRYTL